MAKRPDISAILITTVVSLLVWYWAAGETSVEESLELRVEFATPDGAKWEVAPRATTCQVFVKGSERAMRQARQLLRIVTIAVPGRDGAAQLDLTEELSDHPELRRTGVSLVDVDLKSIEIQIDELVTSEVTVSRAVPGITSTEEITIDPPAVRVRMPRRARERLPADLVAEPIVTRADLAGVEAGRRSTLVTALRLSGTGVGEEAARLARFEPAQVAVSFVLNPNVVDVAIEQPLRIQLLNAPEDKGDVLIEPKVVRDVVVKVPPAIADRIRARDALVVAAVQLRSQERERLPITKAISFFVILRDESMIAIDGLGRTGETDPISPHPLVQIIEAQAPTGTSGPQ